MADKEDSLRLSENGVSDAVILLSQLPFKKRREFTQSETPEHPISRPEKPKNKTTETKVYVRRPAKTNQSQQQSTITKLVFDSKEVKKSAKETPQVDEYECFHRLQLEGRSRLLPDYIEKVQKGFTIDTRSIFVDWVVKIAEKIKLPSDLIHLTVSCIDRYLSVNAVERERLQLLGVSSMLLSLKDEYLYQQCANDLWKITGAICTKQEVVKMEDEILESLEFKIRYPTVIFCLRKYTKVSQEEDKIYKLRLVLCDYLADLSLLEYECLRFFPSLVAAAVVFLSKYTIRSNLHPWTSALLQESGYEPGTLKECVLLIHDWQTNRKGGGILNAVRNKYSHMFKYVSELSSPEKIPEFFFGDTYTTSMVDEEVNVSLENQSTIETMGLLQQPPIKKPEPPPPPLVHQETHITIVDQLPSHLRSLISKTMNVPGDGHCGFRAIADLVGFGINSHGRIRQDLLLELIRNKELYNKVFMEHGRVEEILEILDYFKEPAPKKHWFCLPEMGYLVASHYNVALVCLYLLMPATYLPLRTPIPKEPKLICVGLINNDHFIKVNLVEGCPLPPVAALWYLERDECSTGWLDFFRDRLEMYIKTVDPSSVDPKTESIDNGLVLER